ncbi:MAG: DUF5615 family PIN-like protein [Porticoccaceae bacterium]|nr:DUF5615 family PIN-like protein [Porticoccaceae bacterium]
MKLLLDQNLSRRIIPALCAVYPDSSQVSLLGMDTASDREIWIYAKDHSFSIVTLDADFHEHSLLMGGPPLVIWLKCGNQPKAAILDRLLSSQAAIEQAFLDDETWCLEIY